MLNAFRHQRKEHGSFPHVLVGPVGCSTPFGINGRNTRPLALQDPPAEVLNAFRHQRKEHGRVAAAGPRPRRVLNAFRHQRKEHGSCRRPSPVPAACAQRLSASTEGTRSDWRRNDKASHVLNAFRHQRKEHGRADAGTVRQKCSTPFGINGRNTPYNPGGAGKIELVLNAFRHQRKEHCQPPCYS